jgi:hypothetical protein
VRALHSGTFHLPSLPLALSPEACEALTQEVTTMYKVFATKGDGFLQLERSSVIDALRVVVRLRELGWTTKVSR